MSDALGLMGGFLIGWFGYDLITEGTGWVGFLTGVAICTINVLGTFLIHD